MNDEVKKPKNASQWLVDWIKIDEIVNDLAKTIKASGNKYKYIYGVPRGGLVIACMLSHKLNIPYTNKLYKNTLIVDDICDSGKTLIKKKYKKFDKAVLFTRASTSYRVQYKGITLSSDVWIVFPWEIK